MLNVDYLIVGSVLGAAPLGIYLLAFNLSSWPTSIVGLGIGRVAFAGFARLVEDRRRLVDAYPRTIGVAVAAILPVVLLLGVLAPEVIRFVYGEKWLPAVTALRFLLVLGGLRIVLELFGNLISADGRPQVNLAIRFVWLVALVPVLLLGAHLDGIRGVGIGHMVVVLGLVLPMFLHAVAKSGIRAAGVVAQLVAGVGGGDRRRRPDDPAAPRGRRPVPHGGARLGRPARLRLGARPRQPAGRVDRPPGPAAAGRCGRGRLSGQRPVTPCAGSSPGR